MMSCKFDFMYCFLDFCFSLVTLFLSITFAFSPSISSKAAMTIIAAAALQETPVLSHAAAKFGKDFGRGFEINSINKSQEVYCPE